MRLRGSEERQTSIFLDGAPLSVPWDGRVDLSALPAGLINSVRVTKSAAPIEYGANSVLGVVDLRTSMAAPEGLGSVQIDVGTQEARSISATGNFTTGPVDWLIGGGYRSINGEAVSNESIIPFGPIAKDYRANTDLESGSAYVGVATDQSWGTARVSLLSVVADRGIANTGHIDPDIGSPRYWRYPDWQFNQLTMNSAIDIGDTTQFRTTAWLQFFEQTIDQYMDDSYTLRASREEDDDLTLGLRTVLDLPLPAIDARLVANAQTTQHDQIDTDLQASTAVESGTYQQDIFSLGAELDFSSIRGMTFSAALSYDMASTPKTGQHAEQSRMSDWAASLVARWQLSNSWNSVATIGQRTRFPTLRELYGEALGSFLINPDLTPETAFLADLTFEYLGDYANTTFQITPWILRIDDTLSRRTVLVDGRRLRQRYNIRGSKGYGVEFLYDWTLNDRFNLRLQGNWQNLEAREDDDGSKPVLYQRPESQVALALDYLLSTNWDLFAEFEYFGTALDEAEDGTVVTLPTAVTVDLQLFRTISQTQQGRWRLYGGVDNMTNALVLPQLGLPMPGRTAVIGFQFESS